MKTGKRNTKQRQKIIELLRDTNCHPTADWIYEQARKQLPDISLGTVYRNLQVLVKDEEIQELNYGSSFSRFDGNAFPHYHFVCLKCGEIQDLNLPVNFSLDHDAASAVSGNVEYHRTEFYGTCARCLKEKD